MPDHVECTPVPAPPPIPPGFPPIPPELDTPSTPPILDPVAWEDFAVFRETFLLYFTESPYNAALRVFGRLIHELVLEYYHHWPSWPEGVTATELRAALADLRHLEGYLASVGREHQDASLSESDTVLSVLASRLARELSRVADEIEQALGGRA
ncbi:MAG TPA: hypothetical protein VHC97_14390 [Thermoanaerobaculia bacterium]|jgi:hypothetical protein|nr:hypothetical protein [Thermoanaerobaculia bacterium]